MRPDIFRQKMYEILCKANDEFPDGEVPGFEKLLESLDHQLFPTRSVVADGKIGYRVDPRATKPHVPSGGSVVAKSSGSTTLPESTFSPGSFIYHSSEGPIVIKATGVAPDKPPDQKVSFDGLEPYMMDCSPEIHSQDTVVTNNSGVLLFVHRLGKDNVKIGPGESRLIKNEPVPANDVVAVESHGCRGVYGDATNIACHESASASSMPPKKCPGCGCRLAVLAAGGDVKTGEIEHLGCTGCHTSYLRTAQNNFWRVDATAYHMNTYYGYQPRAREAWVEPDYAWKPHEAFNAQFTARARAALIRANVQAHRLNHWFVGVEHIVLGLLDADDHDDVMVVLKSFGVLPSIVKCKVLAECKTHVEPTDMPDRLSLTPRARRVIRRAESESEGMHIGMDHLLMGLLSEQECGIRALGGLGLTIDGVRARANEIMLMGPYRERLSDFDIFGSGNAEPVENEDKPEETWLDRTKRLGSML